MPVLWAIFAPIGYGFSLMRGGKPGDAIAPLKAGIAFFEATGGKPSPVWQAHLAEATALTGDIDTALLLIDEATAQADRPGGIRF
jgi:hypothetical protein